MDRAAKSARETGQKGRIAAFAQGRAAGLRARWQAVRDQPATLRRSLLVSMAILILLTTGLIGVTSYFLGARPAAQELSRNVLGYASDQARSELANLFGDVDRLLDVSRHWGENGLLSIDDWRGMEAMFKPVIGGHPQVSSVILAEESGREWLLLRRDGGWINRLSDPAAPDGASDVIVEGANNQIISESREALGYDARTRPWFQLGLTLEESGKRVGWTAPYKFFTTEEPGITAVTYWRDADGQRFILAFDVLLADLSRMTTNLQVSARGRALITDNWGRVLGLPAGLPDEVDPSDLLLVDVEEIGLPELAVAESLLTEVIEDVGLDGIDDVIVGTPFDFESEGETWWGQITTIELWPDNIYVGVFLPQSDMLTDVAERQLTVVIAAILALALSVYLAGRLAGMLGEPLERLAEQSERLRKLDLDNDPLPKSHIAEVDALADTQGAMTQALDSFSRYVPVEVVRELMHRNEVARIGGRTESLTILFTDIVNFTQIAESIEPAALAGHMEEYFDHVLGVLQKNGATIDKLIGDSVMAFWGAPAPDADHAAHAVDAALACQQDLARLNREWVTRGKPRLETRFGLNTGRALVGNFGAKRRLAYTAFGDTVNLASRLEGLNKHYGTRVLAAAETREGASADIVWRRIDRVKVKGRLSGVDLYEPLGRRGEVPDDMIAFAKSYETALAAYQGGRFEEALEAIETITRGDQARLCVRHLTDRCAAMVAAPPPPGWDPATVFPDK